MSEVKVKNAWKASGSSKNECFNPLPVLKPAILEPWDRIKLQMPERSYEKYALSKSITISCFMFSK